MKYQYLLNKSEEISLKYLKDPKGFIEYQNDIKDICSNIEEYNPGKERKVLVMFDHLIADMISNKKHCTVVTELFIRGWKLNIFLVFITQLYFPAPRCKIK